MSSLAYHFSNNTMQHLKVLHSNLKQVNVTVPNHTISLLIMKCQNLNNTKCQQDTISNNV